MERRRTIILMVLGVLILIVSVVPVTLLYLSTESVETSSLIAYNGGTVVNTIAGSIDLSDGGDITLGSTNSSVNAQSCTYTVDYTSDNELNDSFDLVISVDGMAKNITVNSTGSIYYGLYTLNTSTSKETRISLISSENTVGTLSISEFICK